MYRRYSKKYFGASLDSILKSVPSCTRRNSYENSVPFCMFPETRYTPVPALSLLKFTSMRFTVRLWMLLSTFFLSDSVTCLNNHALPSSTGNVTLFVSNVPFSASLLLSATASTLLLSAVFSTSFCLPVPSHEAITNSKDILHYNSFIIS